MERPKLAPILERAIADGVLTEAQARDADAFADGIASRVTSGEITEAEGDELTHEQATRDGLAMRRARLRRGLPPLSVAMLLGVLLSPEDEAPEPVPQRPPEDEPGPELAPGEVLYTVPHDPEAEGKHVRGRVVRAVVRAGEIAIENGWSAAALRSSPRWLESSLRAACVRQAVKWGLVP